MFTKLTDLPDRQQGNFVLWAYRYGSIDRHSYPVGYFTSLEGAKRNAKLEFLRRGGKYSIIIYMVRGNSLFEIYEIQSPYKKDFLKVIKNGEQSESE